MRQPLKMEAGKKYRGYGLLNEYGEFEFVPEETGSRKGVQKVVRTTAYYTLSVTKKNLILHINISKGEFLKTARHLLDCINDVILYLRDHEL